MSVAPPAAGVPAGLVARVPLDLEVRATGTAAGARPLPPSAIASVVLTLRNSASKPLGPVSIAAVLHGVVAASSPAWRPDGGRLLADVARIDPGAHVELGLDVRVPKAPMELSFARVAVEARVADHDRSAETILPVADCAGAYRERLAVLKRRLLERVRDAAEALRRPDPRLPAGRLFPLTGARTGELRDAEQLAAALAAYRGADRVMAGEGMRFLIARWTSELSAFAGQTASPGLCADNRHQIAGYRIGLAQVTNRLTRLTENASHALAAARETVGAEGADLAEVVRRAASAAGVEPRENTNGALGVLADVRAMLARGAAPGPEPAHALSVAETAAWLAETAARAKALAESIEDVFAAMAQAHSETCVCAF